jgi:hypothetical protein
MLIIEKFLTRFLDTSNFGLDLTIVKGNLQEDLHAFWHPAMTS